MLRHLLSITVLRNMRRHRLQFTINIVGFALGLACSTMTLLFVLDELSCGDRIGSSTIRLPIGRVALNRWLPNCSMTTLT